LMELRLFAVALALIALVALLSSPPHTAKLVVGVSPPQPYPLERLGFSEAITTLRSAGYRVVMTPIQLIPSQVEDGRALILLLEPLQCPETAVERLARVVWRAAESGASIAVVVADDTLCGVKIVEAIAHGAFSLEVVAFNH